jgi:hypothetical protein
LEHVGTVKDMKNRKNSGAESDGAERKSTRIDGDKIAYGIFLLGLAGLIWGYGVLSHKYVLFPYNIIQPAAATLKDLVSGNSTSSDNFSYRDPIIAAPPVKLNLPDAISPGMTLVYGVGESKQMFIRVLDHRGTVYFERFFDIFDIWDDFGHLPDGRRPQSSPGGEIAGLILMENGDLVFNFEPAGLVRTNYCGEVIWKLDLPTHHAVTLGENGHFYAVAQEFHEKADPDWPAVEPVFQEEMIVEIGQDGTVLQTISIFDLLRDNGMASIIYESSRTDFGAQVTGDIFHMNDVEFFPTALAEGVFKHGDLMVSLRNANKILVFDPETLKIRYLYQGTVIRQHDPDFIDGDHISIFDNHSLVEPALYRADRPTEVSSKVVVVDALENRSEVYFEGNDKTPFFTDIMGKHQWLPNGNLLVTESRWGRVLELTPNLDIAWEFNNVMETGDNKGRVGFIYEAMRLGPEFDQVFFEIMNKKCKVGQ